ncbi:hypothetical protein BJ912DRAFT_1143594 [Pholiota molesta]|nr:hypothetical protein BJ912DRAFT_1143594 [Pholiota molesta]
MWRAACVQQTLRRKGGERGAVRGVQVHPQSARTGEADRQRRMNEQCGGRGSWEGVAREGLGEAEAEAEANGVHATCGVRPRRQLDALQGETSGQRKSWEGQVWAVPDGLPEVGHGSAPLIALARGVVSHLRGVYTVRPTQPARPHRCLRAPKPQSPPSARPLHPHPPIHPFHRVGWPAPRTAAANQRPPSPQPAS